MVVPPLLIVVALVLITIYARRVAF
jgi:hypothetical protein